MFCKNLSTLTILLLFVMSAFQSIVLSQNPFEIKQRLEAQVFKTDDTLNSVNDTTSRDLVSDPQQNRLAIEKNFDKLKSDNPFEVSHIPLLKKKAPTIGNIEIKLKPKVSNTFIFWIMLFSWALLALVLGNRRDILPKLIQSIFNENMLKLTKKQDGERLNLHFTIIYLVFFINASVFVYLIFKNFGGQAGTKYWFYILCIIILIYIIRHIMLYVLGWIFPLEKTSSLYSFLIMVLNLVIGLLLIPVNLSMAFGPESFFQPAMITGLIFIALALLMRYFRGFFIGANYIFNNIFLFFIYLCAFEITPILIGIRMLRQYF